MLFDLSLYRKPLPENIQVFASGANQETEIRGFPLICTTSSWLLSCFFCP
jgi:hypothetical protein